MFERNLLPFTFKLFYPEVGGSRLVQDVGTNLSNQVLSHPGRLSVILTAVRTIEFIQ